MDVNESSTTSVANEAPPILRVRVKETSLPEKRRSWFASRRSNSTVDSSSPPVSPLDTPTKRRSWFSFQRKESPSPAPTTPVAVPPKLLRYYSREEEELPQLRPARTDFSEIEDSSEYSIEILQSTNSSVTVSPTNPFPDYADAPQELQQRGAEDLCSHQVSNQHEIVQVRANRLSGVREYTGEETERDHRASFSLATWDNRQSNIFSQVSIMEPFSIMEEEQQVQQRETQWNSQVFNGGKVTDMRTIHGNSLTEENYEELAAVPIRVRRTLLSHTSQHSVDSYMESVVRELRGLS